ncbi:MAG: hypothetical protein KAS32_24130 [Candidatus Peribacteraceae bacterium]|nr:hypothetical protein [Candidatus Peribacteraceae bacterium]
MRTFKANVEEQRMKEKLKALLEGQELSEEFSTKLEALIEVAAAEKTEATITEMKTTHEAEITALKEKANKYAEEIQESAIKDLTEKVDKFLDYVITEWATDNAVNLDSQIKVDIAESFLGGLKDVFEAANVVVPEGNDSIVETLEDKIEDLEGRLTESIDANVDLKATAVTLQRKTIVEAACDGLTATQSERIGYLAENMEFETPDKFTLKVKTIREGIESDKEKDKKIDEEKAADKVVTSASIVTEVLDLM